MTWINICDIIYPVGTYYISENATSPSELFGGTWSKLDNNRMLMNTTTASKLGTNVGSGLPNISGNIRVGWGDSSATNTIFRDSGSGALYAYDSGATSYYVTSTSSGSGYRDKIAIDASKSSSIYGASSIVQPPAQYCYIWKRTA